VDLAEARLRTANREMQALRTASAFPALPKLEAFAQAESQTTELAQLGKRKLTARALEAALLQGATATADVAQLYACFEPVADPGDLIAWRWRRYTEGRG